MREGAIALSGDAGIQDIRRLIEAGLWTAASRRRPRRAGDASRQVDIYAEFQAAALRFIDPERVRSRRR